MRWLIPFLLVISPALAQTQPEQDPLAAAHQWIKQEDCVAVLKALDKMHQEAQQGWHPVPGQASPDKEYLPRIDETIAHVKGSLTPSGYCAIGWKEMTVTRLALARHSSEIDICMTFRALEATAVCIEDRDGNGHDLTAMRNY